MTGELRRYEFEVTLTPRWVPLPVCPDGTMTSNRWSLASPAAGPNYEADTPLADRFLADHGQPRPDGCPPLVCDHHELSLDLRPVDSFQDWLSDFLLEEARETLARDWLAYVQDQVEKLRVHVPSNRVFIEAQISHLRSEARELTDRGHHDLAEEVWAEVDRLEDSLKWRAVKDRRVVARSDTLADLHRQVEDLGVAVDAVFGPSGIVEYPDRRSDAGDPGTA